jgi:hypothetical protein
MTKGTTSARLSGGQQYGAGSLMHVFISPDDDRGAGACAPLTPGQVRKPVAASTDSGDASNGERSGGAIQHQRDFRAYPSDPEQVSLAAHCRPVGRGQRRWRWTTMRDIGGGCGWRQEWLSLR